MTSRCPTLWVGSSPEKKFLISLKNFSGTNTLAYFNSSLVTKKKCFMALTPGGLHGNGMIDSGNSGEDEADNNKESFI
jgi:hypothetical protein